VNVVDVRPLAEPHPLDLGADSPWPPRIKLASWVLVALGVALLIAAAASYLVRLQRQTAEGRQLSRTRASEYSAAIERELRAFPPIVEDLAAQLNAGRLVPANLEAGLAAALRSHPTVFEVGVAYLPFATGPGVRLFAPHAARSAAGGGVETFQLERRYDYTTYDWFRQGIVKAGWGEPYFGAATKTLVVGYQSPFFRPGDPQQQPIGVVRINLSLAGVRSLVSAVSVGRTGYGFLLSSQGVYLSHPLEQYVTKRFDALPGTGSQTERDAVERALKGTASETDEISTVNGQQVMRVLQPIPVTGWVLGVAFFKDELTLESQEVRRAYMSIMMCALLLAFGVTLVSFRVHEGLHRKLWSAAITLGALLAVGIFAMWWLTLNYPDRNGETSTPILDSAGLQKFVMPHLEKAAASPAGAPLEIPTGVLVRTIRLVDANNVVVSGDVWQRIPRAARDTIAPGVVMPDAESTSFDPISTRQAGDDDVLGWMFRASLREPSQWSSKYPFDRALVRVRMMPKASTRPAILVPDLPSYRLLTPSTLPGIEASLILPGWRLDHSYFSYLAQDPATVAMRNGQDKALPYDLVFNVVAQRRFLDPFISSILPIIVIVCLLFGLLIVGSKQATKVTATGFKATDVVRASAALLFPALIAQVNLRSKVGASELIYVEYFYFILYASILAVAANAIVFTLSASGIVHLRDNLVPKLLFWPAIVGACFAVSLAFLY
jgi:cache domain-containing protein